MSYRPHKNRVAHNKIDLTGKVFGKLTVLSDTGRRKSRKVIWLCQCECGKQTEVLSGYLISGDTKSCGCLMIGQAHNRTGYKELGGTLWYHIISNAKRRGIPVEITSEEAYNLYIQQDKMCAMTGVELNMVLNYRDESNKNTASLDRIDNSKGYIPGNLQWVHKIVNIMRNKLSIDEFIEWCILVVDFSKARPTIGYGLPTVHTPLELLKV